MLLLFFSSLFSTSFSFPPACFLGGNTPNQEECSYYGTGIDSREHLIACHHSVEEIAKIIGADSLGYLPEKDLKELIGSAGYCDACFTGRYPTEIPESFAKDRFEAPLSQRKKKEGV